jgi:hypothetical protein
MWIAGKKTAEIKKINEFLEIIDNDTTWWIDLIKAITNWNKKTFIAEEWTRIEKKIRSWEKMLMNKLEFWESKRANADIKTTWFYPEIVEFVKDNWRKTHEVGEDKILKDYDFKWDEGTDIKRFYWGRPIFVW